MKFAVYVALVGASNALTGCKKGIQGKVYTDSTCSKDAHSSFNLIEKHISQTGKCNTHTATKEDKAALETATKDLKAAKKEADAKKVLLTNAKKLQVDDATLTADPKVKEVTVAEYFNSDYPELLKRYTEF